MESTQPLYLKKDPRERAVCQRRAVEVLKASKQPEPDRPLNHGTEIDLQIPALLLADYLPDVHSRLVMYQRIASAADNDELRELHR